MVIIDGKLTKAHSELIEADNAWTDELVQIFGKRAGDVRYTKEANGAAGSYLNRTYQRYLAAREAYYAVQNERMKS